MSKFINKQLKTVEKFAKNTISSFNEDAQYLKNFAKQYKLHIQGDLVQIGCPGVVNSNEQEMINLTWLPDSGVAEDKIYRFKQAVKAAKTWESFANNNMSDFYNQYVNLDAQGRVMVNYMHFYTNSFPDYGNQYNIHLEPAKNGAKYFEAVLPIIYNNLNLDAKNDHSSMTNAQMMNHYVSPGQGTTAIKLYLKNSCLAAGLLVPAIALEDDQQAKLAKEAENAKALAEKLEAETKLKQANDLKHQEEHNKRVEIVKIADLREIDKQSTEELAKNQAEKLLNQPIDLQTARKIQNSAYEKFDVENTERLNQLEKQLGGKLSGVELAKKLLETQAEYYPSILKEEYNKHVIKVQAEQAATEQEMAKAIELSLQEEKKTKTEEKATPTDNNSNNNSVKKESEEKFTNTNNNSAVNPYKLTDAELDIDQKLLASGYIVGEKAAALQAFVKDNSGGGGEHNTYNDSVFAYFKNCCNESNGDVDLVAGLFNSLDY